MQSGWRVVTSKTPFVRVPVLSKTTVSALARESINEEPLTSTPFLEAAPIPPKKARGTETTSAHGHDTIRKVRALNSQVAKFATKPVPVTAPIIAGGSRARITAAATTIGVYIFANFVMNFSLFDFAPLAFFTRSRIFAAVDSPNAFSTLARTTPDWLTHPERI